MENKVRVIICGKEYALQTDEKPSYLIGLAKHLDRQICEMVNSADNISMQTAAVLIALSALDEASKSNESIDNIRTQIKDYVDDAGRSRLERDEAVKQREEAVHELEMVKVKLACYENDVKLKKLKDSI
ncbi:MAG: cell division protein ZapA [Oscillospiraceae bacterium]